MIQHYRPEQLVKFAVKPGLTCLAASTGRNTLTIDQQIRADVEYSERQSVGLDIRIVFDTAKMIVAMIGAH
jgi:lipopolysaccharide/colanic/teichoic acid biosynthesis glycosyltransferase